MRLRLSMKNSDRWAVLSTDDDILLDNTTEAEAWACFLFTHHAALLMHWDTPIASKHHTRGDT